MKQIDCDVVVVGCGVAGLSAALTALEAGASVAVLERAPKEDRGGNTRWTEAILRVTPEGDPTPDFADLYSESSGHHVQPEFLKATMQEYGTWPSLVRAGHFTDHEVLGAFVNGVREGLDWLERNGVRKTDTFFPTLPVISGLTGIYGGGLAIVETLCAAIEARKGAILYETTAVALARDAEGEIAGLQAVDRNGRSLRIAASSVVLASGGFQGNREMTARYLGPGSGFYRPVARGGYYNKGEGIQMALDAGAAPAGDYNGSHHNPIDPRSDLPEALIAAFPLGIMVNQQGQRFFDEASSDPNYFLEEPCKAIAKQPGGIAYFVYDAKIHEVPNWRTLIRSTHPAIEAPTLAELAARLQLPAAQLQQTVEEFNRGCTDGPLDIHSFDGRATTGLTPPKSNYARTISTGPFGCYPVIPGIVFTFGGLKVTKNAQVVSRSGAPIRGLYAAGETVGIINGNYVPATSVLRGLVFGRLAGAHAGEVTRASGRSEHRRAAFQVPPA
jgi:tricarballylate dehydrogenase